MSLSSIGHPSHPSGYGRPAAPAPSPTLASAPASAPSPAPAPSLSEGTAPLASTARLLGLSPGQLAGALKAGTSLQQLSVYTGVPTDAVHGSVHDDLRHDAAELSDDQLERIAAGIQAEPVAVAAPVPDPAPVRFDSYA